MARTPEEYAHELAGLDSAHAQNEAGRDAFIALAHTALFAASISFVGDITPLNEAIWRPALILAWLANVGGLLSLTFSFAAARKAIDARRAALNDDDPPDSKVLDRLNWAALWSFPVAILCLFAFVTANVVNVDARRTDPATSAPAAKAELGGKGSDSRSTSAKLEPGRTKTGDGRGPRAEGTGSAPAAASPSASAATATPGK